MKKVAWNGMSVVVFEVLFVDLCEPHTNGGKRSRHALVSSSRGVCLTPVKQRGYLFPL